MTPQEELDALHSRSTARLAFALREIEIARLRGNLKRAEGLTLRLGRDMGEALALADLLGRRRVFLELQSQGLLKLSRGDVRKFAAPASPVTPFVPFAEAIEALTGRGSVLAETADEVRAAWANDGFAIARSAVRTVTENVKGTITTFLKQDSALTVEGAIRAITGELRSQGVGGIGGFTRAYSDTVFRTATSTAYQEGRAEQATRPAVREVAPAWRFDATEDPDVRPNHLAGNGFVAHTEDPIWKTHAPPLGFNCRCTTVFVSAEETERLGLSDSRGNPESFTGRKRAPASFHPDFGFKLGG